MIYILLTLCALFVLYIIFESMCKKMGDCDLKVNDIKEKQLRLADNEILLTFTVPFENRGKQQAIVIDGLFRLEPEGNKYNDFIIRSQIINPELPVYHDNYWEAFLVKPGKKVVLKGSVSIKHKDGKAVYRNEVPEEMYFELYYKYYGRNPLIHERKEFLIKPEDLEVVSGEVPVIKEESPSVPPRKPVDETIKTIPVKTHILRETDTLMEVLNKYVIPLSQEGDIVAIAESVIAILQGRAVYIETIKPGYWATRLNRFFQQDASLSSPYSLEMAIREVGLWRILLSFTAGSLGKCIGRKGDFYRLAGRPAATIDDPPGTMPPFDKYVVLGPKDPQKVSEEIKAKTGLDATVVDANDLGKVDVLGCTLKDREIIVKALKHNPQGNADEQTPIVLIRPTK